MTDASLRIKNLSISLEALSRINTRNSQSLYLEIEALLTTEIEEVQKENAQRSAPPAKPTTPDDNIPF